MKNFVRKQNNYNNNKNNNDKNNKILIIIIVRKNKNNPNSDLSKKFRTIMPLFSQHVFMLMSLFIYLFLSIHFFFEGSCWRICPLCDK